MTERKLADYEWAGIRSADGGEESNVSALALEYGVSRGPLQRRAFAGE